MLNKSYKLVVASFLVIWLSALTTVGQTTAFNFQGRLNDGANPANGRYDLQFKLFDAIAGGNQVGATIDRPNLPLIDGIFSTKLDFGAAAFGGGDRFLEISVRPAGSSNAHVILGARQQIMSVPFAVSADRSRTSGLADLATNAVNAVNANSSNLAGNALNADKLGNVAASEYLKKTIINPGSLQMQGNIRAGGNLEGVNLALVGNATQNTTAFGFPKAMLSIAFNGILLRCYNGFTGASTGDCGYTITLPLGSVGVYRINLGFDASDRFVVVSPRRETTSNVGANFVFNGQFLEIFTFFTNNSNDTFPVQFSVIVY